MGNILRGIITICAGVAIIYFHNALYQLFGPIERAEKNFGDSRQVYIFAGAFLIVIGVLMWFGMGSNPTDTTGIQLWK